MSILDQFLVINSERGPGLAQVPIIYSREVLDEVNREIAKRNALVRPDANSLAIEAAIENAIAQTHTKKGQPRKKKLSLQQIKGGK